MSKPSEFSFHIAKIFPSSGGTSTSIVMNGFSSCMAAEADVINMSLGGPGYLSAFDLLCQDAYDAGILIVAAAGNGGNNALSYPASYASVVSVANVAEGDGVGTNTFGQLSPPRYTQWNDQTEIAAPGT